MSESKLNIRKSLNFISAAKYTVIQFYTIRRKSNACVLEITETLL